MLDRKVYAILLVIALATIGIGVIATTKPLWPYVVESTTSAATTTLTMAWITWWALVLGFAVGHRRETEEGL